MSGSVSSVEGELNAIVKEFLEYSKLTLTLSTFEEECQKLGKPIQDNAGKSRQDERICKIKNELLQHFDNGRRTEFFSEWETHINPEIRENNIFCQKLEFSLQIHFAVLPMRKLDHWSKEEVDEAMVHFHYYLESKGSVLSECTEFLPYYALPYVPHPKTHPSFQDLFQESWLKDLRNKLETFLFEGLKREEDDMPEPRLIELYHHRDLDLQDARKELQYLERHIEESEKRSVLHAKKCEKLQEECRQLMAVASLLVTALENAVKGNLVDMDCVLAACTTHLPDLGRLRSESPNLSSIDENSPKHNKIFPKGKDFKEDKLNFQTLKNDLNSTDNKKKSFLLQALRWRLTKVGPWSKKNNFILKITENDLLELQSNNEKSKDLLSEIFNSPFLSESFARFLNALASFVLGRQYLTSDLKLLEVLVEYLLKSEPKDDVVLDMILGTLKKISIRRVSQAFMVDNGVIEWLAKAFHSKAPLSNYGLSCSVALLFNLSLCPMGKKRCEPLKVELISGLSHLLKMNDSKMDHVFKPNTDQKREFFETSPYVNGTLYRILSISSVREYAKEQELPNALKKLLQKADGEAKKQLETILELFVTDVQIEDGSSDEEEDDQEDDSLEPEIDLNDNVTAESNEITGEDLLKLYSNEKKNIQQTPIKNRPSSVHSNNAAEQSPKHKAEAKAASELSVKKSSSLNDSVNKEQPLTPKVDLEATQLVRKIVGTPSATLVEAAVVPDPAAVTIKGLNANEYTVAFSSRPKIPRTPEPIDTVSPKIGASSPLRTMVHKEFNSTANNQRIYCK